MVVGYYVVTLAREQDRSLLDDAQGQILLRDYETAEQARTAKDTYQREWGIQLEVKQAFSTKKAG